MSLYRKSALSALAAIILTGSRFALIAILARRVSPSDFGQFVYVQWLVDVTFLVCSFGLTGTIGRYIAEYNGDTEKLSAFIGKLRPWALGLSFLTGFSVLVGLWLSEITLSLNSMILIVLWAILSAMWAMQTAVLVGFQRFDLIFYANLFVALIMIFGALLLPLKVADVGMLFALMAASSLMGILPGLSQTLKYRVSAHVTSIRTDQWDSAKRYAINVWLVGLIGSLVWSRGEIPLVRLHLGDKGVAEYTVALTLYFGAMQGIMIWVGGIAPHLTAAWMRGNRCQAIATARKFSDIQLLLSGCFALLLTIFGSEVLGLVFGAAYNSSATSLSILVFGLITLSTSNQNHLMQIHTDARFNRNITMIGVVMLFTIGTLTIPWLGIVGAAIARAITMWGLFLIMLISIRNSWGNISISFLNIIITTSSVFIPIIVLLIWDISITNRMLITVPYLIIFMLLIRGENGKVVVIDILRALKTRIFRRV